MNILVSGSLAYDRIMDFPGKFSDHILPDKIDMLNVCFMINGLTENFGGPADNTAFAFPLLGKNTTILATAGRVFDPSRNWLTSHNISTQHIKIINDELTAGAYITTDQSDNQITAFNPGAMKFNSNYDFDSVAREKTLAIVAPGNLGDMVNFSNTYKKKGIDYIFDPGQSLPAWTKELLTELIHGSKIFICNDYELQLTQEKTSMSIEDIAGRTETLIVTRGELGSEIIRKEK